MDTKIKLSVFDVDNAPINGCAFTIASANSLLGGNIPGNEKTVDVENSANGWTITVGRGHVDFYHETAVIHQSKIWTNPTCTVVVTTEIKVEDASTFMLIAIRFVLSRVRDAPTWEHPGSIHEFAGVPTGVLLSKSPKDKYDYRDTFGDYKLNFHRLTEKIIGNPAGVNWDRLSHTSEPKIVGVDWGKFRWLEYGTSKKYAIAVWIPHYDVMSTSAFDFIVFYSPTTADKTDYDVDHGHSYPYGLKTKLEFDPGANANKPNRVQPFIAQLGHRYMFDRLHLTFQLMAARKRAIIVMPINNKGDWGPMTHKQGLHRLLLELRHFVQKQVPAVPHIPGAPVAPPAIRSVAIAGFSSGTKPILAFFEKQSNIPGHDYVRDASGFDKLWTEIWDLDLAIKGSGRPWIGHFKNFMANRPDRRVRMYHSDYTAGLDGKNEPKWRPSLDPDLADLVATSKSRLTTTIPKSGATAPKDPRILAEELHLMDGRWTITYLSEEFLTPTTEIVTPDGKKTPINDSAVPRYNYRGKHDFIANIGFAHAALMSKLQYPR